MKDINFFISKKKEIREGVEKKKKRNTRQKAVVFQVVRDSNDHPTAEVVYERAKKELPTISLGTVYRILKELVSEGKIKEIVKTTDWLEHQLGRSLPAMVPKAGIFPENAEINLQ